MLTHAFLQEKGAGQLGWEEQLVRSALETRGLPVTLFHLKRIQRRQLPLTDQSFIVGDMDAMHGAMHQLRIIPPASDDYPAALRGFLHRRVWASTLGAVERAMIDGNAEPVFVKPADRRKSFTGRVFQSIDDFRVIGHLSRRQTVWCSEIVEWLSEFRIYVAGSEILSIDCYHGDASVSVDRSVVEAALSAYRSSGMAPRAYGIDFGILATGQTALIEANDGYSLGAYQINAPEYTGLLMARWEELLSTRLSAPPSISA